MRSTRQRAARRGNNQGRAPPEECSCAIRESGRRLVILLYQIIVAITALAIWQACATWKLLDPTVISSPGAVFGYLFGDAIRGSELWTNFYYTMAGDHHLVWRRQRGRYHCRPHLRAVSRS